SPVESSDVVCITSGVQEKRRHFVGQRERGGQAGRLDAEQIHETRQAMLGRPADAKVRGRLAGAAELGTNTRVGRLQAPFVKPGPVAADGRAELLALAVIEGVVHLRHPLYVRAETYLSGHIQGHVNAETGMVGDRIDEAG